MLKIEFSRKFEKQYVKLLVKAKKRFNTRLELWRQNPNDQQLHDHALTGKYQGYRSINISGDIRALYTKQGNTIVIFGFIGTHGQIYG